MDDEDGRLKDEVVEELRKRRNDDSELVPQEEVEKQVRDDSCEKSLEVVDTRDECQSCGAIMITGYAAGGLDCSDCGGLVVQEPLVRLSSLQSILDRFKEIADEHRERSRNHAETGEEKDRYACASVADVIHDEVTQWRNQLEEVTQQGEQ